MTLQLRLLIKPLSPLSLSQSLSTLSMEPTLPPTAAATTTTSPRPPIAPSKLRLMCSYGGHIVPRPHDKSLFYAGGESRIVAVDRRTTAASLAPLTAHISRSLFSGRPFLLKYQLPDEDLDSLISVVTDEDLCNMLEEHDRIAPPARIRLFLFPVKPESVGSALLDPKSETWFSDALKSTGILQKGQSADSGLLMGIAPELEAPVASGSNSGGDGKPGAESLVLETSSSFGSTNSSFSMSNSPPIGTNQCDEKGLNLLDRKIRVPSSHSIESEINISTSSAPLKAEPPLIQMGPEESTEDPFSDPSFNFITTQNPGQLLGYPLSNPPDTRKQQLESQLVHGSLHYIPQSPSQIPMSPYYHPVYQMPIHPQHISCQPNQPYPIYLVPVNPAQYPNMPIPFNSLEVNQNSSSVRPVAPQSQVSVGPHEPQVASETIGTASVGGSEFDEDIVYNQIYKSQPLPPVVPSQ